VEAPEGTEARNSPSSVVISTSTVGLPRESKISRALTDWILDMASWVPARELVEYDREGRTKPDTESI
jgi:hypothetical protein